MQNAPEPIWAYDQRINDFRLFSNEQEWKDHINVSGAISYLGAHLQKSLRDDFYPAYEAYYKKNVGFFALPRIVFPYITFLGTLLGGSDDSRNASRYMNAYMGRVNTIYSDKELCQFIYRVYRHGLSHTNMPKVVSQNGQVFGWMISFDETKHLCVGTDAECGKTALLPINPKKLADEVVSSIDEYIGDLKNSVASFDNFKKGFISMASTVHYTNRERTQRIVVPTYLKNKI